MAITHVDTQTAIDASDFDVTVTKPTGTAEDDVMLAFMVTNNQNVSTPAGWTQIIDEVISVFRLQVYYKVAGGSEPSNYTFSVSSSTTIWVATISAWRGVNTSDIFDGTTQHDLDDSHSEPYTTPSISTAGNGRLIYFRSARAANGNVPTFSEATAGVSEIVDVGTLSGPTVAYASALYSADADYTGGGTKSGLAITCSTSEVYNHVVTIALKSGVPAPSGSLQYTSPVPTMDMTGSLADNGPLEVEMPLPVVDIDAFYGDAEGTLDYEVPVTVAIGGNTPPRAVLDVQVPVLLGWPAETRRFAENVVNVEVEHRWITVTEDDAEDGIRDVRGLFLGFDVFLPEVSLTAVTGIRPSPDDAAVVDVEVFDVIPHTSSIVLPGDASATVTTYDAVVAVQIDGDAPAGQVAVSATSYGASVPIVPKPGSVPVSVTVNQPTVDNNSFTDAGIASSVLVSAFNSSAKSSLKPGSISVSVTVNQPTVQSESVVAAGSVSASVTANSAAVKVGPRAGHAAVTCHN